MKDIGQVVWMDRYVWNEVKIQLDHVRKEQETESLSLTGTCVNLSIFKPPNLLPQLIFKIGWGSSYIPTLGSSPGFRNSKARDSTYLDQLVWLLPTATRWTRTSAKLYITSNRSWPKLTFWEYKWLLLYSTFQGSYLDFSSDKMNQEHAGLEILRNKECNVIILITEWEYLKE